MPVSMLEEFKPFNLLYHRLRFMLFFFSSLVTEGGCMGGLNCVSATHIEWGTSSYVD
jgi:hypothetical protein